MTLYVAAYVLGTIFGLYMVWDIRRMRIEAQKRIQALQFKEAEADRYMAEAAWVWAKACEIYGTAVAWQSEQGQERTH